MDNKDYKHVILDITNAYIGAKLSYGEIMDIDEVPHKLKIILDHTILREVHPDTKIEDHIFFIKENDISYQTYKRMHATFRLLIKKEGHDTYESKEYSIEAIVANEHFHEIMDSIFVQEIHIPKLYLLGKYGENEKKSKKKRLVNMEDYIDDFLGENKDEG